MLIDGRREACPFLRGVCNEKTNPRLSHSPIFCSRDHLGLRARRWGLAREQPHLTHPCPSRLSPPARKPMDERCQRFATDAAAKPEDPKTIATLRKFLFRNQATRLSAAAQQYLCDAIVRHAAAAQEQGSGKESSAEAATALVEDALAMPFNILTTSHKKQLLKHLDRLRGAQGGGGGGGGVGGDGDASNDDVRECSVLEVTPEGKVELMDDDGETATVQGVEEEHLQAIREGGEDVRVKAVFVVAAAGAKKKGSGGGGAGSEGGFKARILGIL